MIDEPSGPGLPERPLDFPYSTTRNLEPFFDVRLLFNRIDYVLLLQHSMSMTAAAADIAVRSL